MSRAQIAVRLSFAVLSLTPCSTALGQGKDKKSAAALFADVPADLRSKVRDNPVRCDRVNDWLEEHVNGKGKFVELQMKVSRIKADTRSKDGTYFLYLRFASPKLKILDDEWNVFVCGPDVRRLSGMSGETNFTLSGISAVAAEKLVELKEARVGGTVKFVLLPRYPEGTPGELAFNPVLIVLEDLQLDGASWPLSSSGKKIGKGFEKFLPK